MKVSKIDAITNAKKLLIPRLGTTKPAKEKPLSVNADMEIFGTKIVKR